MSNAKPPSYRRYLLPAGVAAIIISGVFAGATLKTDHQKKQAYKKFKQESQEERIARLEKYLEGLRRQKDELEDKIIEVEMKKAKEIRIGESEKRRGAEKPVKIEKIDTD